MVWLPYDAGLSVAADSLVRILKRVIVSPAVYPCFLEIAELARSLCHCWATCFGNIYARPQKVDHQLVAITLPKLNRFSWVLFTICSSLRRRWFGETIVKLRLSFEKLSPSVGCPLFGTRCSLWVDERSAMASWASCIFHPSLYCRPIARIGLSYCRSIGLWTSCFHQWYSKNFAGCQTSVLH